jgi:hypothetical protein
VCAENSSAQVEAVAAEACHGLVPAGCGWFALLRLLAAIDRDKDLEILALRPPPDRGPAAAGHDLWYRQAA